MPWEEKTVEKLREEFVLAAKNSRNFSAICREFGISRKTGYKWMFRASVDEPISDRFINRSTAPQLWGKNTMKSDPTRRWGLKHRRRYMFPV